MNEIEFDLKIEGSDLVLKVVEVSQMGKRVVKQSKLSLSTLKTALDNLYSSDTAAVYREPASRSRSMDNVMTREQNQEILQAELRRREQDS